MLKFVFEFYKIHQEVDILNLSCINVVTSWLRWQMHEQIFGQCIKVKTCNKCNAEIGLMTALLHFDKILH